MKKLSYSLSILLVLFFSSVTAFSQVLGNEWINYNQSYFKFKVWENGIYRIPQSLLQANGLGNVNGSQFALFRDGVQVPVYVSTNGTFGPNDYIEFYGAKADGKTLDKEMYEPNTSLQGDPEINLLSDTAAYFLTFGGVSNLRLTLQSNVIPPNPPAAEPYCITTVRPTVNIRNYGYSAGESYYKEHAISLYYYSAKQERGEGLAYSNYHQLSFSFPTAAIYTPANPILSTAFLFNSKIDQQPITFYVGGSQVFHDTLSAFEYLQNNIPLNQSYLTANNTGVGYITYNPLLLSVLKTAITYNRTYDFNGVSYLNFIVPANGNVQRLVLSNLNASANNTLVDFNTNSLYHLSGDQVMLNATSQQRNMFFANSIKTISGLAPVTFRDYTNAANQGNYIILSHGQYINHPNGSVNQYASYRRSATGGGYQVVVVDVNDLYDQFGYGCEYHPVAIKRFLKYAQANTSWVNKPEYMFILGKGLTYNNIYAYRNTPGLTYPVVPTYGQPGSDNLFAEIGNSNIPSVAVGRLSAMTEAEIGNYLEKIKKYEVAISTPPVPNLENTLWKKRALHIAGATDEGSQAVFYNSLNICKSILEDTMIGGFVTTVGKSTINVTENASEQIDSLIASGVQYVNFYGHASAVGFDYNLNNPDAVNSSPRFPIFMAYGCDVAAIYEATNSRAVSEKYLVSNNGGAVAMIACSNYGWTGYLDNYMQGLYRQIAREQYGATLGKQFRKNIETFQNNGGSNIYVAIHSQNMILQGDPGLKVYSPELPDFYIDESLVATNPGVINTTIDSFEIKATLHNLGKATREPYTVRLTKTKAGSGTVLYKDSVIVSTVTTTNVVFKVPIDPSNDIGLFNYTIALNEEQSPDEITFANNKVSIQMYISEDNLKPVYPYDFSIVHEQNIELKASTLNPFLPASNFILEIDTTEYFNSPFKQTKRISSIGGVIKWQLPFQMTDSTVYYWRTTIDSMVNGRYYWNNSSFVYLKDGSDGWNQSHFFQYKKDDSFEVRLNEPERLFKGRNYEKNLLVQSQLFGFGGQNNFYINGVPTGYGYCGIPGDNSILFVLINPVTGEAMRNTAYYPGVVGACDEPRARQFEFPTGTAAKRKLIIDFIDSIKDQYYVMVKSNTFGYSTATENINQWKTEDEALNGPGISLYQSFMDLGLTGIAQYTEARPFIGLAKKGSASFVPVFVMGTAFDELIVLEKNLSFTLPSGYIESTVIGPAAEWQHLRWKTSVINEGVTEGDKTQVTVYGLNSAEQLNGDSLFTTSLTDYALNSVSATQYPYLRLKWYTEDSISGSLPQLDYWRVLHKPLPEAALNPATYFSFKDTLNEGEAVNLKFAIENLRELPMDSMLVRFRLIDANNTSRIISEKKYKPLAAYDTLIAGLTDFNPAQYLGKNVLLVEANPDKNQPEHYHPNNLGYLPFYVKGDHYAPVMDVTFDGVHILNKDIVSAKPFINILIRDENRNNLIIDTSRVTVSLMNTQTGLEQQIRFDGNICRFIPASGTEKNEARVEFRPTLEDGIYTLKVSSRDNSGNISGSVGTKYEISFEVINKSTITNVLNYPNPFSTATQFLFTLTGAEIPSQFKIQIISITGKVVREIKKAELGNIHIGRNRTEYKWDGRDEFGQLLGNGVYLYRVITSNKEGESIERRNNASIDRYFKNDYGKLYIMR